MVTSLVAGGCVSDGSLEPDEIDTAYESFEEREAEVYREPEAGGEKHAANDARDEQGAGTLAVRRADLAAAFHDAGLTSVAAHLSTGITFVLPSLWISRLGGWADSFRWVAGDFSGDGLDDLATIWNDGGFNTITVRQSTGSTFTTAHWVIRQRAWMEATQWFPGDFDGDGRADLAEVMNDVGSVSVVVHRSTGTSFELPRFWQVRQGPWISSAKWTVGDFNRDGRSDLAAIWNDGGFNTITIRQSTGSFLTTSHWAIRRGAWSTSAAWLAGDYNGDGYADLASAWNDGGYVSVAVFPSTGAAFGAHGQWQVQQGGWDDTAKWTSGDFNGDGWSDLAAIWNDSGYNTITVRQSTGSGFTTAHWAIQRGLWASSTKWCAGTFH